MKILIIYLIIIGSKVETFKLLKYCIKSSQVGINLLIITNRVFLSVKKTEDKTTEWFENDMASYEI